jgi:hypothetical protein
MVVKRIFTFFIIISSVLLSTNLSLGASGEDRPSLKIKYENRLQEWLVSVRQWHPFPTAMERDAWYKIPERQRFQLITQGEVKLNASWPALPATLFMEFYRNGNKANYHNTSLERRNRLQDLVLAECVEGDGRFLDEIINGIWAICEETFWGNSPSTFLQEGVEDQKYYNDIRQLYRIRTNLPDITRPGVDLWIGETVGLLAWTVYLLGTELDEVSPLIRERILYEADRRVLTPCRERDFFWMKGKGNWNPWITSNWLMAVLLLEQDDLKRISAINKIFDSLDYFLQHYPGDGGCDEGPGYWRHAAASLYDCLEILSSASKGRINIFDQELIKNMGRYIYRVHIAEQFFMNFADSPAKILLPAELLLRYGKSINDPGLVEFGSSIVQLDDYILSGNLYRQLAALFNTTVDGPSSTITKPPLPRDVWLEKLQVMAARSKNGEKAGLFLGAKGGSNGEGHNHNDVGNFLVYANGVPVIIDVGPEIYTAKNSSLQRYDIWTMQSGFHNLPTIGGIMQHAGKKYAAKEVFYHSEDKFAQLSMDIAGAYSPEAGLSTWKRTVCLKRGSDITVTDSYHLLKPASELYLSLMTPCLVHQVTPGVLKLTDDNLMSPIEIRFEREKWQFFSENIPLTDKNLTSVWGEQLTRILLKTNHPPLQDTSSLIFIEQ